jgi:2-(1,2-epoxy-1,2-dihydrophenyl)acetyl-CoA isomerase
VGLRPGHTVKLSAVIASCPGAYNVDLLYGEMNLEFATIKTSREGSVATVSLNRPDKLNSFNAQLRSDLAAAIAAASADTTVRAIVLAGEGRLFSAGADLAGGWNSGDEVEVQLGSEYKPSFTAIEAADVPVIAAINGSASGIGMSLALHCDLLVMADDAFLLAPFATIGLVPDGGANWALVRQLGYRRAYQLAIESERLPAQRALELGLVNRLAAAGQATVEAQQWAEVLSQRAPKALAATKRAMRKAAHASFDDVYSFEAKLQSECIDSKDFREGIDAFMNKRKPVFTGE